MKKFIIYLLFLTLMTACQSVREGFTLKKKETSDEFLVEKKSPLVMPPSYEDLPTPEDFQVNANQKEDEFESIINTKKETDVSNEAKKTSIEKSVIDKIN
tara:strand:+ start:1134 stop:1433 length:300 start_codon:yes stop_codon:yes gene_type:complete